MHSLSFSKLHFWKVLMKDHYGRPITYLRLSVTELCNLRCRYCMPEEGICRKRHEEMLTEEEMIDAVKAAASLGVRKVRITGGEPLVKKNILSICRKTARVPGIKELCLTTNGILLPQMARELRSAGVQRLNISLDTLQEDRYQYITRTGQLSQAKEGLRAALNAGFAQVTINAVLIGGFNEDEIPALAELSRQYPVDVRFIELMPMYDSGDFGPDAYIPGQRVLDALSELEPVPGDDGVAKLYRLPGAMGRIGLINPISAHFCRICSRIRITADGFVKPCLHRAAEYCLKGCAEEEMRQVLQKAILEKPEWHGELSVSQRSGAGRNMNQIGG